MYQKCIRYLSDYIAKPNLHQADWIVYYISMNYFIHFQILTNLSLGDVGGFPALDLNEDRAPSAVVCWSFVETLQIDMKYM